MSFSESTEIVGRKDHRCSWCHECIAKGEKHWLHEGAGDDGFWRTRLHQECNTALRALSDQMCHEDYEELWGCAQRGHTHEPDWGFDKKCPGCQQLIAAEE